MAKEHYGTPILVKTDGESLPLERLPISGGAADYNEAFIQELAFKHPKCLPINEIDRAYEGLIPVCMELKTPAGPLSNIWGQSKNSG